MIEPRCVRGSPDEVDVVGFVSCPPENSSCLVGREVVQNEIDPFSLGIPLPHELEHMQGLLRSLARPEVSPDRVGMHVQKAEEVSHAIWTSIGCWQSMWMP